MGIKVRIPTPLQSLTGGNDVVEGKPGTIMDLVIFLEESYPGIGERLSEGGKIVIRNNRYAFAWPTDATKLAFQAVYKTKGASFASEIGR